MLRKLEILSCGRDLKQLAWLVQLSKAEERQCGYSSQNCCMTVGKICREGRAKEKY